MAYTSEIEKLEQRFAENRRGRTFAPLADAYRKAGLIDNAIELCQEGLKVHPDYVSAWIVYGRCLMDKKDEAAAREVYEKVLALDPENVLALRTLADIAERANQHEQAAVWLNRLLAADPMSGDAAEALARVKSKAALAAKAVDAGEPPAQAAASEAPGAEPAGPPVSSPAAADTALELERASPETLEAVPTVARPVPDLETADALLEINADVHAAAKAEGLEVQEEVELKPDPLHVEGLARTQYEGSGMFQLDHLPTPPPPEVEEPAPPVDLPLIMPEELEAEARSAPPPPAPSAPLPPPPAPVPPPAPAPAAGLQAARPPVGVRLSDDDGAADRSALSQVEPVVTETMAELYLRQGHTEDALRVYRALAAQRPGDGRLLSKIQELAGGGRRRERSGQSAGAYLKSILRSGTPPRRDDDPPVSSLVARAFEDDADVPGEPTKPASDALSLDVVFGEGGGESLPGRVSPESAPGEAAAGEARGAPGGFSFDEFFTPPGADQAPRGGKAEGGQGGEGGESRPSSPADDAAEMDQFQAWLKKLKS